jgi:hypothetical protein
MKVLLRSILCIILTGVLSFEFSSPAFASILPVTEHVNYDLDGNRTKVVAGQLMCIVNPQTNWATAFMYTRVRNIYRPSRYYITRAYVTFILSGGSKIGLKGVGLERRVNPGSSTDYFKTKSVWWSWFWMQQLGIITPGTQLTALGTVTILGLSKPDFPAYYTHHFREYTEGFTPSVYPSVLCNVDDDDLSTTKEIQKKVAWLLEFAANVSNGITNIVGPIGVSAIWALQQIGSLLGDKNPLL